MRWLAEKCAPTNGRLQWAAVLPLLQPDKAVEELRWAKEHGACGIFKRGFDLDRKVTDPHFFPVYEEASALELPLCIHTGHPLPGSNWNRWGNRLCLPRSVTRFLAPNCDIT